MPMKAGVCLKRRQPTFGAGELRFLSTRSGRVLGVVQDLLTDNAPRSGINGSRPEDNKWDTR
jgi:hypothetical protein